ncbi:Phospholipase_D3-like [Hexamita inflata]|uniref:Phospholipase_D3-like n=1 Tax=Hexamita inflata TaxID=28002 RepID=A0ABP1HDL9_9EUKA
MSEGSEHLLGQPEVFMETMDEPRYKKPSKFQQVLIYSLFALSAVYMMVCLLTLNQRPPHDTYAKTATNIEIIETVPDILVQNDYKRLHRETYLAWLDVINRAESEICIAAYYSTMFCVNTPTNTCKDYAAQVVLALQARSDAGVKIRLLIDGNGFGDFTDIDTYKKMFLNFEVAYMNTSALFGGVQHSKIIISDKKRFYVGSSNLDWRALTEVKEIGVFIEGETEGAEMQQVFEQYWACGTPERNGVITLKQAEKKFKKIYNKFNQKNPLHINDSLFYIAQSPPKQLAQTRTHDLESIISQIQNAKTSINIQSMDYSPLMIYTKPQMYWDNIESELRAASIRGVKVKIMIQENTYNPQLYKSLTAMKNIELYFMKMDTLNEENGWDHTRLTHSKFISVDGNSCVITTSNWTGDYFTNTQGTSIVLEHSALCQELDQVMNRDISSTFVKKYL